MLSRMRNGLSVLREYRRALPRARGVLLADLVGQRGGELPPDAAITATARWLARAQDLSASNDGGVARHFSVRTDWSASYPETTGYVVPTMLELARRSGDREYLDRARRMLDWLRSIQMPSGAFQGGTIRERPVVPVTFNTGQILLGLAAGVSELGDVYRPALRKAADWLVESQDPDGCWRRYPTPFAIAGEKAYETHVAWSLFEADRADTGRGYGQCGLRNVYWALGKQRRNGWVDDCCLTDPTRPLTHTLGYFLRGLVEAYRFSSDHALLSAAMLTANGLLRAQRADGSLPGRLTDTWAPAAASSCLTGNVQIAHSWLLLFEHTRDARLLSAAQSAIRSVRRTISVSGDPDLQGAVRGSYPIWGDYAPYEFPNWAAKFYIDAQMLACDVETAAPEPLGLATATRES